MALSESTEQSSPDLTPCVSLCYDGTDVSHLETAVPCLDEFGLSGTFFANAPRLLENALGWQAAANGGHEIGSHPFLEAADELGRLHRWTLESVEADLRAERKLVSELFPRQPGFCFAYPGPDPECMSVAYDPKPTSYRPAVERVYEVARSAISDVNDQSSCAIGYLASIPAAGLSAEELAAVAELAVEKRAWALLVFRGIGVGPEATDQRAHRGFCSWLSDHRGELGTPTVWRHAMKLRSLREAPLHGAFVQVEGAPSEPIATDS
jgi:peptidoglycan/xylan/chitin deacetylase (PgdA/CDA1 family)